MAIKKTTSKAAPSKSKIPVKKSPDKKAKSSPAKSKKGGSSSLAALWDAEADASAASNILSEGEKEVRLNSMILKQDPKKGDAVFVEVEAIDGDEEGKKARQMFKLTDGDGKKQAGMDYLAQALALLGYENVGGDELEDTLEEITEQQPMIVVRIKDNGQYTNMYIQGLAENIEAGEKAGAEDDNNGELEVGTRVSFEVDGEDKIGTIAKKLKDGSFRVKGEDGDNYEVEPEELTIITDEPEEEEKEAKVWKKGDIVTFDDDGDEKTGTIKSINKKNETAVVVDKDDEEYEVDFEEMKEAGEEEEDEDEIEVGDTVKWEDEDENDLKGEVVKIIGDKAKIKDEDDDIHKVELSKLTKVD